MRYRFEVSGAAQRQLAKLPSGIQERIAHAIKDMERLEIRTRAMLFSTGHHLIRLCRVRGANVTYSLDLNFIDDRKSKLPHPPIAEIFVKTHTAREDGLPIITPECVTIEEFEYQIERLQKELEALRTKARKKFALESRR